MLTSCISLCLSFFLINQFMSIHKIFFFRGGNFYSILSGLIRFVVSVYVEIGLIHAGFNLVQV